LSDEVRQPRDHPPGDSQAGERECLPEQSSPRNDLQQDFVKIVLNRSGYASRTDEPGTADHAVYRKRSLYRRNRSRDESSRQDRGGPPLPDKKEAQAQAHHRIDSICRLLDRTRKLASPGKIAVIVLRFPISHLSDFFCLFFM